VVDKFYQFVKVEPLLLLRVHFKTVVPPFFGVCRSNNLHVNRPSAGGKALS